MNSRTDHYFNTSKWFLLSAVFFLVGINAPAQSFHQVSFPSTDDFDITADLYHLDKSAPTLILFHQSVSSRGEYRTIAPRFNEMKFNCLAVDLRWGKQDFWNKVPNESAKRNGTFEVVDSYEETTEYQVTKVWPIIWKAYEDMKASIAYLKKSGYNEEIVVMGSSFSAMMIFKLVSDGLPIDGIVAFSPGEYHPEKDRLLASWTSDIALPVYISGGVGEKEMVEQVRSSFPSDADVRLHYSKGRHGASVLINQENDWPPLNQFLSRFHQEKKAIGFSVLKTNRKSEVWDESRMKPINAWYWYPLSDGEAPTKMSRMEYVTKINPDKTEEENLETYKRIVNSLTADTLTDNSITSYLRGNAAAALDVHFSDKNFPLIVLSGAHPIYFVTLAEQLGLAGFNVVCVPRAGMKKGERLPFSREGVEEYREDMNTVLDYLDQEGLTDMNNLSFISWSFEGVPSLEVALERKTDIFISLDSSIGYAYGMSLLPAKSIKELPFKLLHYTGSGMDYGKDLNLLESNSDIRIIKKFDLVHSDFTSLKSIIIPKLGGEASPDLYGELVEDLLSFLKNTP